MSVEQNPTPEAAKGAKRSKPTRFGFDEVIDGAHHFLLQVSETGAVFAEVPVTDTSLRITLSLPTWKKLASPISAELRKNYQLSLQNARFMPGDNKLPRMPGREILPVLLAAELAEQRGEVGRVKQICHNWVALEEHARWWLYTLANTKATETEVAQGFGWKHAIYFGLAAAYA